MPELSKEFKLLQWCFEKKIFNYVDIRNYSLEHFYLRADRQVRDFVTEGKIRRIPKEEAILRGLLKVGRAPLAYFEVSK